MDVMGQPSRGTRSRSGIARLTDLKPRLVSGQKRTSRLRILVSGNSVAAASSSRLDLLEAL